MAAKQLLTMQLTEVQLKDQCKPLCVSFQRRVSLYVGCVVAQTGFLSSTKKGSIFSVPDGPGGKVGVVGSGKKMTENPTFVKHDYSSIGQ